MLLLCMVVGLYVCDLGGRRVAVDFVVLLGVAVVYVCVVVFTFGV